jgi:hypothetical protein
MTCSGSSSGPSKGSSPVKANHLFLLYAHDWLAFAHIMLAVLFAGAIRDPGPQYLDRAMRAHHVRCGAGSGQGVHSAAGNSDVLVLDRFRLCTGGGPAAVDRAAGHPFP